MGSIDADEVAGNDEKPQHSVYLDQYLIGKYEVTVAQFRAFVAASGYKLGSALPDSKDNHPVTQVSWDDAVAFCRWASVANGRIVRLPTEAEWEKAARGTDGRLYPWGNAWDASHCNAREGGKWDTDTTPVGYYSPAGDSPYGCADMAGNVWEWTRSVYKPYPYDAKDGREELGGRGARVSRGGLWPYQSYGRCTTRGFDGPLDHFDYYGFRVVVSPGFRS